MSYEINIKLGLYCGLSESQAAALLKLHDGGKIHQNQFKSFVASGLVVAQKDQVNKQACTFTDTGSEIFSRMWAIQNRLGTFVPMESKFTPDELNALAQNAGRLARKALPKQLGLRAAHMKVLVEVGRHPGIVIGALLKNFGADEVGLLLARNLVGGSDDVLPSARGARYTSLHLETKALSLLNWCLNEIKLAGE